MRGQGPGQRITGEQLEQHSRTGTIRISMLRVKRCILNPRPSQSLQLRHISYGALSRYVTYRTRLLQA
jgi:hypothetical protein